FEIGTWSTALSYRRGAWKRMSRTLLMPKPRRRFASDGPTPGREPASASRRCGGRQPRGGGHWSWSTPVKPACLRVIVATATEDRTRCGRHRSLVLQEPEEADRPRPCVCADDGAERRRDLDVRLRALVLDQLAQCSQPLGRRGVCDPDLQVRRVGRRGDELVAELGKRLVIPANAFDRDHL